MEQKKKTLRPSPLVGGCNSTPRLGQVSIQFKDKWGSSFHGKYCYVQLGLSRLLLGSNNREDL